ncbi:MAG: anaerobic ribonucleoside-triphosphate reductase activating protein [Anaerolineae bacterium]|nr:anaerobic ribonucleoside-triphosphate reductase activating protein [Anaerolineae bacterium]
MHVKGWVRSSLIDYPEHIAAVLFTGGCNFRCPMCHNGNLVLTPGDLPDIPQERIFRLLGHRIGLLDGVVISGGEPMLQSDLADFIRKLRSLGLHVKLDTNGYSPDGLAELLKQGLIDYVAMDVKAPPAKYPLLTGRTKIDVSRIERSVDLLLDGQCAYEFRTTVVPGLLNTADIDTIGRWIKGGRKYVLQQFRSLHTLDPDLHMVKPYPVQVLREMTDCARAWVDDVSVRE